MFLTTTFVATTKLFSALGLAWSAPSFAELRFLARTGTSVFEEAVSELRAAAERGDTEAAALLDVAKAERALHGDGDGPERSG